MKPIPRLTQWYMQLSGDDWAVIAGRAVFWTCIGAAVLWACGVFG